MIFIMSITIIYSGKLFRYVLRAERMIKRLTQAQLAEIIYVHEKYIGRIETGKQNITVKMFNKLANALNIDVCRLL